MTYNGAKERLRQIPRFNMVVNGAMVDAYWPSAKLVVELDGHDNHSSKTQLRRNKRK